MQFPSLKEVSQAVRAVKSHLEPRGECDIRLQVYEDGEWAIRWGLSDYDLDHRGYWGATYLTKSGNCRDVAIELLDEVEEHHAMNAA